MRAFAFLALLSIGVGASFGAIQPADKLAADNTPRSVPQTTQARRIQPDAERALPPLSS